MATNKLLRYLYHFSVDDTAIPRHTRSCISISLRAIMESYRIAAGVRRTRLEMLVLRALPGVGEAAFSPEVPFLLSFFFKRDELAFRTGLFISAAHLATSFASSLAWLITEGGEHVPWRPGNYCPWWEGFPFPQHHFWRSRMVPDS